jgi:hypothetical protein
VPNGGDVPDVDNWVSSMLITGRETVGIILIIGCLRRHGDGTGGETVTGDQGIQVTGVAAGRGEENELLLTKEFKLVRPLWEGASKEI